jgi:hydroxymethylpyrimidine/phosphomethylpyrimidine kinase
MGARNVLITGGHLEGDDVIDLFYDGALIEPIRRQRIPASPHGTGCVLSAAIAGHLALNSSLHTAVLRGAEFTARAIRTGLKIGAGRVSNPTAD